MNAFVIKTSRTGDRPFEMGRVNVFLGANGTGKSRLLAELRGSAGQFLSDYSVVFIEGGRAIEMRDSLELNRSNFDHYKTSAFALRTYQGKRTQSLSKRVYDALMALERMGQESKEEHSDAVEDWVSSGSKGDCPRRKQPPIERVFEMFCEIFPRIELSLDTNTRRLICQKDGAAYGPTQLSDGEKQALSILADIVELAEPHSLLLVDEPELNLNPQLATRLWEQIESLLPESKFIYATHSVSFAMRSAVDRVIVLSNASENIQEIDGLSNLGPDDLQALLGNIPAILSSSSALIVEGIDRSFDSIFYKWLLDKHDFEAVPMGGSEDVIAVLKREGVWSKLSANLSLLGVIDRDYKTDENLKELPEKCVALDLHEAESYLCQPRVLTEVASAIGTVDPLPSEDDITTAVKEYFRSELLRICARRVFVRSRHRIGISLHKRLFSHLHDYTTLEKLVLEEAKKEVSKAAAKLDPDQVKAMLQKEWERLNRIIEEGSVEEILALCPGKELLRQLAPRVGCKDQDSVARAARRHIVKDALPLIPALRDRIMENFPSANIEG